MARGATGTSVPSSALRACLGIRSSRRSGVVRPDTMALLALGSIAHWLLLCRDCSRSRQLWLPRRRGGRRSSGLGLRRVPYDCMRPIHFTTRRGGCLYCGRPSIRPPGEIFAEAEHLEFHAAESSSRGSLRSVPGCMERAGNGKRSHPPKLPSGISKSAGCHPKCWICVGGTRVSERESSGNGGHYSERMSAS